MRRLISAVVVCSSILLSTIAAPSASAAGLPLTLVDDGFSMPLYVTNAGDSRLFVVEQEGLIKIIDGTTTLPTPFLDLSGLVSQGGGERGLLGLAFHPSYATNGLFYVNYTRQGDHATVVAEYKVSNGDPNVASPGSARILMTIAQPFSNHNGGWMGFRGTEPYLYIGNGDGGSGGDPGDRAQNLKKLLGKMLRINPLDPDGNGPLKYSIPSSNPYVGKYGRDEIWSSGLRNPWRCSFDRVTLQMWCGDVGQNAYEEINRVDTGWRANFGWRLLEGFHYYNFPNRTQGNLCTSKCRKKPILEYSHTYNNGPCASVTGGYVSRRSGAVMEGKYVFGDYCSGKVWIIPAGFVAGGSIPAPMADTSYNVASFGEGSDGKLYLVDYNGAIYSLDES